MQLTPHDEFVHKGYPKSGDAPWKENYYFNFIDQEADAMGIFHASIQRHRKVAVLKVLIIIDGELFNYTNEIPWPTGKLDPLDECAVVGDGKLFFRILEPYLNHQVLLNDGETSIELNYSKRFPAYLYPEKENTDQALSVLHYEQGMHVLGKITYKGETRSIACFGHRDHTWGYRDESGLAGWHWIAIQSETSTWNFSLISRQDGRFSHGGFVCKHDKARAITDVQVLKLEHNTEGEPMKSLYRVTTEEGDVFHVRAKRYRYIPVPLHSSAFVHENISEFTIEETGEKGIGIDEHMIA